MHDAIETIKEIGRVMVTKQTRPVDFYICGICGLEWTTEDAANRCEAQGLEPLYEVGTKVEVLTTKNGTPENPEIWVPAVIVEARHNGHWAQYELDHEVNVSGKYWIGKPVEGDRFHNHATNDFLRRAE